ncbi:AAA family ATPase [Pseudoduganella eburnea]|uniref:AAA family ATPase n=1 Tax=Massilia eburnea TaxID=1776165 RepID=A0A6L6QJD3_9BURK|nr:LuxR family transcriptional regulator [Massilia eburnea]MTW12057.1 AAA family ATPase [Massilia eburnea]
MLLERERELETLQRLASRADSGVGGMALVLGEAGIGKSSLLQAFAAPLRDRFLLLQGACEDLSTPRALGPLRDFACELGSDVVCAIDNAASPDQLMPLLLGRLAAQPRPVLVLCEDLHWADQATLDLLKYLARRIAGQRIVLLASVRNDELPPDHAFWRWAGDLPAASTQRIALSPLSPQAVATLARDAPCDPAELYRVTGGNPFFLSELLTDCDSTLGHLPASVRDAVWARMSRLPAQVRTVLELVSVSPVALEEWLLEAVLGDDGHEAIDGSVDSGLLQRASPGHLSFRHELARQAVLSGLRPAASRALHKRLCKVLTEQAPSHARVELARLVHHATGAQDAHMVLQLAPRAARQAARLGAHRQAAAHLASALQFVDAVSWTGDAAQLYEDWAYEAGLLRIDERLIEARKKAIELWQSVERPDKAGLNLRWLARTYWYRGESKEAERYGLEAIRTLEQLPNSKELAMAYSMRSQHQLLQNHPASAIEWGRLALELATTLDDHDTRVHALTNIGSAKLFLGDGGGQQELAEGLQCALAQHLHEHAARIYSNWIEYAVVFKQFALAERLLAEGLAYHREHELDAWVHYLTGWQAQLHLDKGEFAAAAALARQVLALPDLSLVMRLPALTVLGRTLSRQGEAEAARCLQEALQWARATGESQRLLPVLLALVEAAWQAQDIETCRRWLEEAAQFDFSGVNAWDLAEVCTWQRRAEAAPLPECELPPPAPRAAELSGNGQAACDTWLALGLPYEAALALLDIPGDAAAQAMPKAVALLEQIGAVPAAAMARQRARACGAQAQLPKSRRGPYAAAREHPSGLTRREAQVLELLLEGLSNLEIAQRLCRSERTVEHHVSTLLGKMGASTRLDLLRRPPSSLHKN